MVAALKNEDDDICNAPLSLLKIWRYFCILMITFHFFTPREFDKRFAEIFPTDGEELFPCPSLPFSTCKQAVVYIQIVEVVVGGEVR